MNFTYNLSLKQMRFIYVILGKISVSTGDNIEDLKESFKTLFCQENNLEHFSCSPYEPNAITQENASLFIDFLLRQAEELGVVVW